MWTSCKLFLLLLFKTIIGQVGGQLERESSRQVYYSGLGQEASASQGDSEKGLAMEARLVTGDPRYADKLDLYHEGQTRPRLPAWQQGA